MKDKKRDLYFVKERKRGRRSSGIWDSGFYFLREGQRKKGLFYFYNEDIIRKMFLIVHISGIKNKICIQWRKNRNSGVLEHRESVFFGRKKAGKECAYIMGCSGMLGKRFYFSGERKREKKVFI